MTWNWKVSGLALALCFFAAIALVKPIGVSTQFVIFDGILAASLNPDLLVENPQNKSGYSSTNAYLNKSGGKYAGAVAKPMNYSFVFVLAMIAGGFIAALKQKGSPQKTPQIPMFHQSRFSNATGRRYLIAFIGGIIVLFGARLAGGCTSGHMMSGMMQTAVSGYLFTAAVFATAIPVSILLYNKGGND